MEKREEKQKTEILLMNLVSANRSFTLIELLLVLILMGLVYSFVANSFTKMEKRKTISLQNLPETLRQIAEENHQKELRFLIYGYDCNKYTILGEDGTIEVDTSIQINSKNLIPYRLNYYGDLVQFQFFDFYHENSSEKVCLEFQLFKNGSNSSYILEDEKDKLFYLYRPYFQPVEIYKSFEDAKENLLREELNPKSL
ncbi:MAG TPA: hypothetical protein EYO61_06325 [Campylobacterales bacterium]|nr:hypothetical protein [Campylobacterales bacterium]HIO70417.1 hypothetical protein [Campylobacterales bacterium]